MSGEHTYQANGAGRCSVCNQPPVKTMTVQDHGGVMHYRVATHPLFVADEWRPAGEPTPDPGAST